jgi:hypothetical protein
MIAERGAKNRMKQYILKGKRPAGFDAAGE